MYDKCSDYIKFTTHLDHVSHCKTISGTIWSNKWTHRLFIIDYRRDSIHAHCGGLSPAQPYLANWAIRYSKWLSFGMRNGSLSVCEIILFRYTNWRSFGIRNGSLSEYEMALLRYAKWFSFGMGHGSWRQEVDHVSVPSTCCTDRGTGTDASSDNGNMYARQHIVCSNCSSLIAPEQFQGFAPSSERGESNLIFRTLGMRNGSSDSVERLR